MLREYMPVISAGYAKPSIVRMYVIKPVPSGFTCSLQIIPKQTVQLPAAQTGH
jgi:hypothetical protein